MRFDGNEMSGQPSIPDEIAAWRERYSCAEPGTDLDQDPVRRRAWSSDGGPLEFIRALVRER